MKNHRDLRVSCNEVFRETPILIPIPAGRHNDLRYKAIRRFLAQGN